MGNLLKPLDMIAEWKKGCGNCITTEGVLPPESCQECTRALIEALEARLTQEAITDSDRLVFMLTGHRKVIVECLPRRGYSVYVEQGFMGEFKYPAISFKGDSWENDSDEAHDLKRKAIDAALAAHRSKGVV